MNTKNLLVALALPAILAAGIACGATITAVPASPFSGPSICKDSYPEPQCLARPFDTSENLAWSGALSASPAVGYDVALGFDGIHRPEYANDGFYGNGASWVSDSPGSWIKIDLGVSSLIDRITFGRDRLGDFDGRDPGQFVVSIATTENSYANGDDSNDELEYIDVLDSSALGFSGIVTGPETIAASFDPVLARYVRLTVTNAGAAIDEIEVFAADASVPLPAPLYLLGVALPFLLRRGTSRKRQ
jgi:hypothetical protein